MATGRNALITHLRGLRPDQYLPTFEGQVRAVLAAVLPEARKDSADATRTGLAVAIEVEALDRDPNREAQDVDRLPGAAGNSYWRAMCEANGLWVALRIVRGCPPCDCDEAKHCGRWKA